MEINRSLTLSEAAMFVCGVNLDRPDIRSLANSFIELYSKELELVNYTPPLISLDDIQKQTYYHFPYKSVELAHKIISLYLELAFDAMDFNRDIPLKKNQILEVDSNICKPIDIHKSKFDRALLDIGRSTFTRRSLALWFYESGDLDKAKIIFPDFNSDFNKDSNNELSMLIESTKKIPQKIYSLKEGSSKGGKEKARLSVEYWRLFDEVLSEILDMDKNKILRLTDVAEILAEYMNKSANLEIDWKERYERGHAWFKSQIAERNNEEYLSKSGRPSPLKNELIIEIKEHFGINVFD